MNKKFDISEISKLCEEINKQGKDIKSCLKKGVKKTTAKCAKMAKDLAPYREGILKGSINFDVKETKESISGEVEPTIEYAVYPEFGTGQRGMASDIEKPEGVHYSANWKGQSAQPYMYPAYLQTREDLLKNIEKELKKVIKD